MDALPREDAVTSRKRHEARLLDDLPFMPWMRRGGRFVCDALLSLELPRDLWGDELSAINGCLTTRTGCMAVSMALLLVDVAREAHVNVMIEELLDKDSHATFANVAMSEAEETVVKRLGVKGYRFWILCSYAEAATMGELLARRLVPAAVKPDPRGGIKRKRGSVLDAAEVKRPGIYHVGNDSFTCERDLRVAIAQHTMGMREVHEGPWQYTVHPPNAGAALDAGENGFDDDDDDTGGDDTTDGARNVYPDNNPFSHFFAPTAFADASTGERWGHSWNLDASTMDLNNYWDGRIWQPVFADRCTLIPGTSDWFDESMALPDEHPPLEQLKKRFCSDHRDRGLDPPDMSEYTMEDIRQWHMPQDNEDAILAFEHSTYLPLMAETRNPQTWTSNSSYALAAAYPGMSGAQHTIQCARRVAARCGNFQPFLTLLRRVMHNTYGEATKMRPDCYNIARVESGHGTFVGVDRQAKLARAMHGHISRKLAKRKIDFGSLMIANICQVSTEYYGLTQRQSVPFMVMFRALGRLGYYSLGTAIFVANMAEIDTGKTWVLERIKDSMPPKLIFDMGSCTKNAFNLHSHGLLVVVDDAGEAQSDAEHKLRSMLSNSKHSHTKNVQDASGAWEVKTQNYVFNNSQYWNTNGALSDALFDRTLALLGQRNSGSSGAQSGGEMSKLDLSAKPIDAAKQAAANMVMRRIAAYAYEPWSIHALDPAIFNKTMFSVVVAIARATLGHGFKLGSRLIKLAENLSYATMAMRVSSCWYRKLQPEHYEVPVVRSDGTTGGNRLLECTDDDKHLFFMTNLVVSAMDAYRSLEEVRRNSDHDSIRNKLAAELSTMVEYEKDLIQPISASGRDDYWVTSLQVGNECRQLADHLAGFSYENGIVTTLWRGIVREKHIDQPIIGTGTGKYKNNRTVLASWVNQAKFMSSDEIVVWRVLLFIFANRPDLWSVEFTEERHILFSNRVLTLLRAPGNPDANTFTIPDRHGYIPPDSDHLIVPPGLPDHRTAGAGALERCLHKMALRPGFDIEVHRDSANVIDSRLVPNVDGWSSVIGEGLCAKLKGSTCPAEFLLKRVHQQQNCIEVLYDDFAQAKTQVESDGIGAAEMTPDRKRLLERCIALDGLQQAGDDVVVGASVAKDSEGRCFESYTYTAMPNFASVPNPNRRGRTPTVADANDDMDYISGSEDEEEKPIEYDLMPETAETVKFETGTYLSVMEHHSLQITGQSLPAWCNPQATHFAATELQVQVSESGNMRTVNVMRGVSIAETISRFLETDCETVEWKIDTESEWEMLPAEVTSNLAGGNPLFRALL